jgi:SRSO17 transposase
MNKFLNYSPWSLEETKNIHKNQITPYISKESSMIIDDSISHRPYANKVEGVSWHYDHTNNKQSLGYCIVTSTIISGNYQIPYNIEPYYKKKDYNPKEFKTKNEITKDIILSCRDIANIKTIIFDSWFSNNIVIGACKEADKNYITQIKSNRNVTIDRKKRSVKAHSNHLLESD